jgi:hypothetical protein
MPLRKELLNAKFNTLVSYSLRFFICLHVASLAVLSRLKPGNSDSRLEIGLLAVAGLICALFVLDLATKKDPSRNRSKLVDTALSIMWILLMGALVLYSLSMGTL